MQKSGKTFQDGEERKDRRKEGRKEKEKKEEGRRERGRKKCRKKKMDNSQRKLSNSMKNYLQIKKLENKIIDLNP